MLNEQERKNELKKIEKNLEKISELRAEIEESIRLLSQPPPPGSGG